MGETNGFSEFKNEAVNDNPNEKGILGGGIDASNDLLLGLQGVEGE